MPNKHITAVKKIEIHPDAVDINKESKHGFKDFESAFKEEELRGIRQDRGERKKFANRIFVMLALFLCAVLLIVFLCAAKCVKFKLTDAVLITLLSTASANVISIFVFVMRYLFNTNK